MNEVYCEDCGKWLGYGYPSTICQPWHKDGCHFDPNWRKQS